MESVSQILSSVSQILLIVWLFYVLITFETLSKKERQFYSTKEGYKVFLEREKTKREYYKYKYSKECEKHEKDI